MTTTTDTACFVDRKNCLSCLGSGGHPAPDGGQEACRACGGTGRPALACQVAAALAKGRAVTTHDPRKPAVVARLKAASGCRKVTQVVELRTGGYAGNCMYGPAAQEGSWWVP